MVFRFPGFPDEVSDVIELPDIGELLMYPAFHAISPEHYLKFATDFQRLLLFKTPLTNDRRFITIRSGVWLLEPGTRSHVNRYGDWHVDGTLNERLEPEQNKFILSSNCSALTEFSADPIEIEASCDDSCRSMVKRICSNPQEFPIKAQPIEPCRIYTFRNHIHRAVDPRRVEFRFFFRVEECDTQRPSTERPVSRLTLRECATGEDLLNVEYSKGKVSVYYPKAISNCNSVEEG